MSKKTVVFDLDHTLLDADQLKKNLFRYVQTLGVSKTKATINYKQAVKKGGFTIVNYGKILFKNSQKRKRLEKEYISFFIKPKQYNYSGAEDLLKNLSKKYSLILLTYGAKQNQSRKIKQSRLTKYFEKIIITSSTFKKHDLNKLRPKNKDVLIIDNSPHVKRIADSMNIPMIKVKEHGKDRAYFEKLYHKISKLL